MTGSRGIELRFIEKPSKGKKIAFLNERHKTLSSRETRLHFCAISSF
jgi:hypothetical protein